MPVNTIHVCTYMYMYCRWSSSETLVDAHGRTYYMDHRTHTMAFEQGRRPPSDMTREREHLERRSEKPLYHTQTRIYDPCSCYTVCVYTCICMCSLHDLLKLHIPVNIFLIEWSNDLLKEHIYMYMIVHVYICSVYLHV